MKDLEDVYDKTEMVDEYLTTDESDIDALLEHTRDMIAENEPSYDSQSYLDFESLVQNCVTHHFLDYNVGDDEDSMTSESSFSGYVNEENGSYKRHKSALLLRKDIMSENAHQRMKGIIARKKTTPINHTIQSNLSQDNDKIMTTENNDITLHPSGNEFEFDTTTGEDSFILYEMTSLPKNWTNNLIKYESDSSDSIGGNILPRQTRQRKYRRRTNKQERFRGESIKPDSLSRILSRVPDQKRTMLQRSSRSLEKSLNFTSEQADSEVARLELEHDKSIHDSFLPRNYFANGSILICTHLKEQSHQDASDATIRSSSVISSELCIDTTNVITPSLVKKGIEYYDIPKIECALARMLSKMYTIDRRQKVLRQLLERRCLQINEAGITKKGMALVHKLRAERKMALQARFHRYSKQKQYDLEERPKLAILKNLNSAILKPTFHVDDVNVPTAQELNPLQSPSSLFSLSSIEERNRFKTFIDKTKRTLSHSLYCGDREGLLHNQFKDQFLTSRSYSSSDKAVLMPKTSPIEKMKFSRSKGCINYEALSPASSLSTDSYNDTGDFSMSIQSPASKDQDVQLQSSGYSEWSDMSFLSNPNRFAEISMVPSSEFQKNSYHSISPPSIQPSECKTFNDSFDEIVLRSTPNLCGKNFSNRFVDESPIGVMDFIPKSQQPQKEARDNLAFVDDDEENHVFTDKEDTFVMKSPGKKYSSPVYQPVFFSPSRFEI